MASILVLGEPGTGKSRAIKNLDPSTTFIIKPNNKQLPFPGAGKSYNATEAKNIFVTNDITTAGQLIKKINDEQKRIKTIVIEDLTHYFSARVMKDAAISGFDKWMKLATDTFNSFVRIEADLREDLDLIVIAHTQAAVDAEGNAIINLQTPGKLLENNIKIPSYFTYVLHSVAREAGNNIEYKFLTNREGGKLAKSPEGCFDRYVDNDYKEVLNTIHKYQNG
jgi:hypothetical protein